MGCRTTEIGTENWIDERKREEREDRENEKLKNRRI